MAVLQRGLISHVHMFSSNFVGICKSYVYTWNIIQVKFSFLLILRGLASVTDLCTECELNVERRDTRTTHAFCSIDVKCASMFTEDKVLVVS